MEVFKVDLWVPALYLNGIMDFYSDPNCDCIQVRVGPSPLRAREPGVAPFDAPAAPATPGTTTLEIHHDQHLDTDI